MLSWRPPRNREISQLMSTVHQPHRRSPHKGQKCPKRKRKDVPNSKADASDVVRLTTWFPNVNCLRTFHAILANSRGTLLLCVNDHQLSGRQFQIIHQLIRISCSSNTLPGHRCIHLLPPPSMSLSRDTRTSTNLNRSFLCDWLQLTSQGRAC